MIDLSGKTALIVGGTTGIGRGIAFALASAGARVACASQVAADVTRMADELRERGAETLPTESLICDATDLAQVRALMATVGTTWGRLDVLVNCQGIHHKRPTVEVEDDLFAQVMRVNLESVFRVCREAHALLRDGGCIINIASMGSFIGLRDAAAYTASKGAVAQLTKALAVDWAADGIRANAIAPGWILTSLSEKALADPQYRAPIEKRIPMGRIGTVEDVAGVAVFLASDLARYVTGVVIPVDGGALASV